MNKLFKKSVLSCGFEAAMKDGYTIIASTMGSAADSLRNPEMTGRATNIGIIAAEPADEAFSAGLTKR